jgi:hypothetical protein
MKEKLKRSLALAAAPLVLISVTIASASTASAAVSAKSAGQATIQATATRVTAIPAGYPSIWSLECNSVTYGKIGVNPITGQLYMCEYVEGEGYLWLPILVCPNTSNSSNYAADRPSKTC